MILAKIFNIPVIDKYRYFIRISYQGSSLKPNDVIFDNEERFYVVLQVAGKMALIITKETYKDRPYIKGKVLVVGRDIK